MKDRLSYLRGFDGPTFFPSVMLKDNVTVEFKEEPNEAFDVYHGRMIVLAPTRYACGPIIDRLYAYESLGYDPCELKDILKEYKELKQKSQSTKATLNSIYGSGFRNGKVYPYAGCVNKDFIKEILKDGEHSVNMLYSTDGVQVTILPFNVDEEDAE